AEQALGVNAAQPSQARYPHSTRDTLYAWAPWAVLVACCALWGTPAYKAFLNNLFAGVPLKTTLFGSPLTGTLSLPAWDMPALHNLVQRMPPVAAVGAKPEAARVTLNGLSAACRGDFRRAALPRLLRRA